MEIPLSSPTDHAAEKHGGEQLRETPDGVHRPLHTRTHTCTHAYIHMNLYTQICQTHTSKFPEQLNNTEISHFQRFYKTMNENNLTINSIRCTRVRSETADVSEHVL